MVNEIRPASYSKQYQVTQHLGKITYRKSIGSNRSVERDLTLQKIERVWPNNSLV